MRFRNLYNLETSFDGMTGFDGMVLEISITGGAYADILTAGGSFVSGGYNRTLSTSFSNPLPGRLAWTGLSGGTSAVPTYITTLVNLPDPAIGQNIQLRWRVGSDNSNVASGQAGARIDTIALDRPPTVVTGVATAMTPTGATLNGTVNTNGSAASDCHFEYGSSPSYGSSVPCASLPGAGAGPLTGR